MPWMADSPEGSRKPLAKVIQLRTFPPKEQPDHLNDADALKLIKLLAADSDNIVIVRHAQERQAKWRITRPQIERCVRHGVLSERPFLNLHGNWQMNLSRFTAGEQITCVVAIEWAAKVIVITTF